MAHGRQALPLRTRRYGRPPIKISDPRQRNFRSPESFPSLPRSRRFRQSFLRPSRSQPTPSRTFVQRFSRVRVAHRIRRHFYLQRGERMIERISLAAVLAAASLLALVPHALAQKTLGGITGTVSDKTGSVLPETAVTIVGDQTQLTRTRKTNANGSYDFVNLPIGTYALTFTHVGFVSYNAPATT